MAWRVAAMSAPKSTRALVPSITIRTDTGPISAGLSCSSACCTPSLASTLIRTPSACAKSGEVSSVGRFTLSGALNSRVLTGIGLTTAVPRAAALTAASVGEVFGPRASSTPACPARAAMPMSAAAACRVMFSCAMACDSMRSFASFVVLSRAAGFSPLFAPGVATLASGSVVSALVCEDPVAALPVAGAAASVGCCTAASQGLSDGSETSSPVCFVAASSALSLAGAAGSAAALAPRSVGLGAAALSVAFSLALTGAWGVAPVSGSGAASASAADDVEPEAASGRVVSTGVCRGPWLCRSRLAK